MNLLKRIALALAFIAGLQSAAVAQSSFTAIDGGQATRTFAAFACRTSMICSLATPADINGNAFGVSGNPFYMTFDPSAVLPAFAAAPSVKLQDGSGNALTSSDGSLNVICTSGCGGGGGGGNVNLTEILGAAPSLTNPLWVSPATGAIFPASLNASPSLANGNGVVPTQGGSVLSATNGLYANALQGNAALSVTNPLFDRITDGTTGITVKAPSTASVVGDTALVVAISPNNTLPINISQVLGAANSATNGLFVRTGSGQIASGSFASGSIASGAFASGSIGAGAVAAGAYVSGSVLSGAFASGSLASGAVVDLANIEGVITAATAPTKMALGGLVYNSSPLTLTTGQSAGLQGDANGYLKVNVVAGGAGGGAVYGPTAVGSANANPPVVIGGTATGAAGQNVEGLAIKPASTAAATTDLSAVTNESPNSQLSVAIGTTTDAPCTLPATTAACSQIAVAKATANAAVNGTGAANGATVPSSVVFTVNGASTWNTVAASQTAQDLSSTNGGTSGATGDYLSHCVVTPATTSPGAFTILDGTTTVFSFAGGSSSVSNLVPFAIPIGAKSSTGGWHVTTGANESLSCVGKFT